MGQASAADPRRPASPGNPVLVIYTSGTTGVLKAVVHTQASWAAITANILANVVSPGRDSVMLHAASLIHASGTFVLPYWIRGGCAAVHVQPALLLGAGSIAAYLSLIPLIITVAVAIAGLLAEDPPAHRHGRRPLAGRATGPVATSFSRP